ncbi:MAG: RraA family protein [Yoonia sp.]|jgi:regulator of RNase E activity RraA|nr:RraA family protein [Yoonia sp.]
MADMTLPDGLLELMQKVDTPTVCNAIEVAQGQRGFDGYTKGTMFSSDADAPAIVGFARTAQIAGRAAPTEAPDVIRARRLDYFRTMADGPRPAIAVVEDVDEPHCVSAWWGEVHTTVHKGLGMAGALTNGVMRDLGDMPDGFPVIAGSIGPSHAFVHVRSLGGTVNIRGMKVSEGDLVHADRHGGLVVPPEVIPTLKDAIQKLLNTENIILEPARKADFDIDKLLAAWSDFEKSRT